MNEKKEFKPYIPADKVMPELTVTSVIIGALLAILFGGANAYLGLRVGYDSFCIHTSSGYLNGNYPLYIKKRFHIRE